MADWKNPKMDWKRGDEVSSEDFNRIEGNIAFLKNQNIQIEKNTKGYADAKIKEHEEKTTNIHGITEEEIETKSGAQEKMNEVLIESKEYADEQIGGVDAEYLIEEIRTNNNLALRVENRKNQPTSAKIGRIWIRTNLLEE